MPKEIIHPPVPPTRWTTRETAQALRSCTRSLQNYRDNEGLPFIRISPRKILYVPSEVQAWARARSKKSNGE